MQLVAGYDNMLEKNTIIKELEHHGDKITHKLHTIIDKTFVMPLDWEDISKLTCTRAGLYYILSDPSDIYVNKPIHLIENISMI